MAHQLVLVLIPDLGSSVVAQVEDLMSPHFGDPTDDELRFDYWKIGGAWDRIFAGKCKLECEETDHLGGHVRDNVCRLSDLPPGFDPGSVVTPDGRLHFFGWRFDDAPLDPEQGARWQAILREHGNCFAVAVDAHS